MLILFLDSALAIAFDTNCIVIFLKKAKVKDEKKASRKRQAEEDRGLMGPVEDNGAVKLAKGKKKEAEQAGERSADSIRSNST